MGYYQALLAPMPVPSAPVIPPIVFYPAPPAPMPVPPASVTPPVAPPPIFRKAYPPGGWALMPNYFLHPTQPYPIGYPPTQWPPYQQYYAGQQGTFNEDSETAQPDKFTSWDPLKLHPFIVSCIMAFNSSPHKFATNCQWVSYTASYLSDIAMLWWQPILVTYPKPSIQGDWGEFVDQLNIYFWQPDL